LISALSLALSMGNAAEPTATRQLDFAQKLGGRRRHRACRSPVDVSPNRRDGPPLVLNKSKHGVFFMLPRLRHSPLISALVWLHVMENVLFKISYPASSRSDSRGGCRDSHHHLHALGQSSDDIASIDIRARGGHSSLTIKRGPLLAGDGHALLFMVAMPLIFGHLTAADYEWRGGDRASTRANGLHQTPASQDYYDRTSAPLPMG
jgi:2-methylcitrate dehydratase PrpD